MLNGFLEIDVHGMTRTQALTAIDAMLRWTNGSAYRLRVIHGYRSGTVLRDAFVPITEIIQRLYELNWA